jgi:bifunctional DNA-binding transcriptional regulator/antitoxin component of YhaV-PrlF toxin-antitoxin module
MREAFGLKPGIEVKVELRDNEIVITKPKAKSNYNEYYISTKAPKLNKSVKIKKLILKEVSHRYAIP